MSKFSWMRNLLWLTLAMFLGLAALAAPLSLQELMTDRKAYDGKIVTVTGTVKSYYEKEDFSSCLLFDNGKACSLYIPGKAGLANEQRARVTGTFWLAKKIGDRHFSNVVEVTEISK